VLRDPEAPLGPQPGVPELGELIEGFRTAGLPVRTTFAGAPLPSDPGLQLTVYRIIQESLTNSLRHARGPGRVDLVVSNGDGRVEITVTDDGGVRTPATAARETGTAVAGGGRGLIGMRERAAVYGGVITAGPFEGGWRTHAVLAWDEENT
jgi:signal transduction histidine kinase